MPSKILGLVIVVVALGASPPSSAEPDAGKDSGAVEQTEEVEEVLEVEEISSVETPSASEQAMPLSRVLGRLHPAVVHLPIGFYLLLVLFDALWISKKKESAFRCSLLVGAATALAAPLALVSGFFRSAELSGLGGLSEHAAVHRNLMLSVTAIAIATLVLKLRNRGAPLAGVSKIIYGILALLGLILLGIGGHLGGEMVYGEGFLPF